jgi:hypothetical protein
MPRVVDAVKAPDGRWVGIRCAACGLVFINRGDVNSLHADHTWVCSERAG